MNAAELKNYFLGINSARNWKTEQAVSPTFSHSAQKLAKFLLSPRPTWKLSNGALWKTWFHSGSLLEASGCSSEGMQPMQLGSTSLGPPLCLRQGARGKQPLLLQKPGKRQPFGLVNTRSFSSRMRVPTFSL